LAVEPNIEATVVVGPNVGDVSMLLFSARQKKLPPWSRSTRTTSRWKIR